MYVKHLHKPILIFVISLLFLFTNINELKSKVLLGKMIELDNKTPISNGIVMTYDNEKFSDIRTTNEKGEFYFDGIRQDSIIIKTYRYGYIDIKTDPIQIPNNDTLFLIIRVEANPIQMNAITKTSDRIDRKLESNGFYQRQNNGRGFFYTKKEIEERSISKISELFHLVPGVNISRSGTSTKIYSIRYLNSSLLKNATPVNVYVDGILINLDIGPSGIDIIDPQHIKAIEVYPSSINAPAIYGGMSSKTGGVILIWTGK